MHLQRLFEIVYLLLYRKKVTAKELAERFEVSTRTIYRDIDTLSAAGIPIYTNKGKDGGIFLMEHFILNRALLSEEMCIRDRQTSAATKKKKSGNTFDMAPIRSAALP